MKYNIKALDNARIAEYIKVKEYRNLNLVEISVREDLHQNKDEVCRINRRFGLGSRCIKCKHSLKLWLEKLTQFLYF